LVIEQHECGIPTDFENFQKIRGIQAVFDNYQKIRGIRTVILIILVNEQTK
jgi:hypothetical protein